MWRREGSGCGASLVVILVPMGYKVSQGPSNKECCYIMSFGLGFFDACMQEPETPLERGVEYMEGTHDSQGRGCSGKGEGMAHMGRQHEQLKGRAWSCCSPGIWVNEVAELSCKIIW